MKPKPINSANPLSQPIKAPEPKAPAPVKPKPAPVSTGPQPVQQKAPMIAPQPEPPKKSQAQMYEDSDESDDD